MTWLLRLLFVVQAALGARVLARLARTARGRQIATVPDSDCPAESVTVLLPVLNEAERIRPCLESLMATGRDVSRIIVIDGGSLDGTQHIVRELAGRDSRVCLMAASAIPPGENGKAHQLELGRRAATGAGTWVLTIDADVRIDPRLVPSMLRHAADQRLAMLSVATRQDVAGAGSAILHPAMLASLVYRMGIPGHATTNVAEAQANGQCCLIDAAALEQVGGFASVTDSFCEDVTLARSFASAGKPVGFAEDGGLTRVEMYADWREMWHNWPRSLVLRDRYADRRWLLGAAEVLAVQALPLPIVALGLQAGQARRPLVRLNLALVMTRLGMLAGTRRAYRNPPLSYWLSPIADLFVAFALFRSGFRRQHSWRGRVMARGGSR
jgi:dolichol-phosphate mannosyltransferase